MSKTITLTLDEYNIIQHALINYKRVDGAKFTESDITQLRKKLMNEFKPSK
jgi:hypothetical protein